MSFFSRCYPNFDMKSTKGHFSWNSNLKRTLLCKPYVRKYSKTTLTSSKVIPPRILLFNLAVLKSSSNLLNHPTFELGFSYSNGQNKNLNLKLCALVVLALKSWLTLKVSVSALRYTFVPNRLKLDNHFHISSECS